MNLARLLFALLIVATPAIAQQPGSTDPKLEATERMLLDEMTAHRNWYATAVSKDTALQQATQQIAELKTQVAAIQKQLDAAKETAATSKAVAPPAPGQQQ